MKTTHAVPLKMLLRNSIAIIVILATLAAGLPGLKASAAGVGSDGYTIITTAAELDTLIRKNPTGKFRLGADINLSGYTSSNFTAAKGWKAIGYCESVFQGTLDGNGYTIRGLWSKGWGAYQGLFSTTNGATIKNLNIELAASGITGIYEVGGIVGRAKNGTVIDNCTVTGGKIVVTGGGYAGGIVGITSGKPAVTISNCAVYSTTTSTSGNYSGGLIGVADDGTVIKSCVVIGTSSTAYSYAGGLVGGLKSASTITASYSSGSVTTKASYAGGLVGVVYEASSITQSCAVGNVSACHYGGGLVGTLYGKSTISQSCAYGNVNVTNYIAGGLVGEAVASTISNCYAQGNVKGTTGVGGLVGYFSGSGSTGDKTVQNCYSSGKVVGTGTLEYGAFSGRSGVKFLGTNYYDKNTAGVSNAYGSSGSPQGSASSFPQGKTTADMKKQATFVGWDFNNIWKIDENETYPYFWYWGYSVQYNANGGQGSYTDNTLSRDYTVRNAAQTGISLTGYRISSWNTKPDGTGVSYAPGQAITLAGSLTLYAIWEYAGGAYCSISYSANHSTDSFIVGGIIPNTSHIVLTLAAAGFARDGWTFTGWNTKADGTGTSYQPGNVIVVSESKVLYAQWIYSGEHLSITYDAAGGFGRYRDDALIPGQLYTIKSGVETGIYLVDPLRVLYWTDGSSSTKYYPGDQIVISQSMTLYAFWGF